MTCILSVLFYAINGKSFFWEIESTVVFCLILLWLDRRSCVYHANIVFSHLFTRNSLLVERSRNQMESLTFYLSASQNLKDGSIQGLTLPMEASA